MCRWSRCSRTTSGSKTSRAGTPTATESPDPLAAVRALAEASANLRGHSLRGRGLRLFADEATVDDRPPQTEVDGSPFALGRCYELALTPTVRRRAGAHLTPAAVARNLVGLLPDAEPAPTVLDPAVGGGAFLLAAADRLVGGGAAPAAVIDRLHGFDIDPGAVAVAEAALALWALDHGLEPGPLPTLRVGDGLLDDLPTAGWVVGNPPFLNQLRSSSAHSAARRSRLRSRWGALVGAYTDDAWLFLAAGVAALEPGGALAMVQPVSVLAARHGARIREQVATAGELRALWVARDRVFDAAVHVCGVVVGTSSSPPPKPPRPGDLPPPGDLPSSDLPSSDLQLFVGESFDRVGRTPAPPADRWGSAASATFGVPHVVLRGRGSVADVATATAGFRDQFYGFVPHVAEGTPTTGDHRLITVGMIDVLRLDWGTRPFRFAKRSFTCPVVDVAALGAADPVLGEWVAARQGPKLLVATQTRVVEVWPDTAGSAVPATPVLSVEPHARDDLDELWRLAAVLSAPAVSVELFAHKFGTALALNSMKLAARDLTDVPLPRDRGAWQAAADLLRSEPADLAEFGDLMGRAFGVLSSDAVRWWLGRLPNRSSS